MRQIQRRIGNRRVLEVILPALNQQDLQTRVRFRQSSGRNTSGRPTSRKYNIHLTERGHLEGIVVGNGGGENTRKDKTVNGQDGAL